MGKHTAEPSALNNLATIYHTAMDERADTPWSARAGAVASVGALAFEWGTGNEALLGTIGGRLHDLTDNPIITGIATGSVSFAEQGTIGVLMATTISNFPKVAEAVRSAIPERKNAEQSKASRFLSVMVLGAGVELAVENAKRPHSRRENMRRAIGSAAIVGVATSAIIGTVSGVTKMGAEHGFEQQANVAVDAVSNPLTYAAAFGAAYGYKKLKQAAQTSSRRKYKPKHLA